MLLKPECIHCGGYSSVGEGTKEVEREEESGEGRRKKKKPSFWQSCSFQSWVYSEISWVISISAQAHF